jgi:diacylglycerol kinase family enzyme
MFDGDILGVAPVEASVVPRALKVVVPVDGG